MSLEEEMKRIREEIEEGVVETPEVKVEEPKEETPVEEVVEETPEVKEEVKEEPKEEAKEEKPDASAFARMRRELAAAKKEAEELKQKLSKPVEEPEDNYDPAVAELQAIFEERQIAKATEEFVILEENFKQSVPDYEDVSNAYRAAIYQSLKIQSPYKSHTELLRDTKTTLLKKAGTFVNQGLDPILELYEEAKSLGIRPQAKAPVVEEAKKPSLDTIAKNKSRNSGMMGAGGDGTGGQLTAETASGLTVSEWSKLPANEKRRLMGG